MSRTTLVRTKNSLLSIVLAVSLLATMTMSAVLPARIAQAAGETFVGGSDATGKPRMDIAIDDLQISGDDEAELDIRLFASGGSMWLENYEGVYYSSDESGQSIDISGTLTDINNALTTLVFQADQEGDFTIEATIGDGNYNAVNEHVYMVIEDPGLTWQQAAEAAESLEYGGVNGYLATITSEQENDFVLERIDRSGWIGANDLGQEGKWRWVTGPEGETDEGIGLLFWDGDESGEPAYEGAFSYWNSGEPNNASESEHCGQIWFTDESNGRWNDLNCSSDQNDYYVVEFGNDDNLPEVASKIINITVAKETLNIDSCDELFSLTDQNRTDNINLTADIDCGGQTVDPLFADEDFAGTFNGHGHVIKNFEINKQDDSNAGLFAGAENATIRNLIIQNVSVFGQYQTGTLLGESSENLTVDNVHVRGAAVRAVSSDGEEQAYEIGGLIGDVSTGPDYAANITNVSFKGTIHTADAFAAGGLIGQIDNRGTTTMTKVYADAAITLDEGEESWYIGGLVGYIESEGDDDHAVVSINDAYSWSDIDVIEEENAIVVSVGGLVGSIEADGSGGWTGTVNIQRVYASGDVEGIDDVGGLVGMLNGDSDGSFIINDSFAMGAVDTLGSDDYIAGLIGSSLQEEPEYSLSLDGTYFDQHRTGQTECMYMLDVSASCSAVNQTGDDMNYFINNNSNAPLNEWDFDEIWVTNTNHPPTFQNVPFGDEDDDDSDNHEEGEGPNNGDANNDGVADQTQANVATFLNPISGQYTSVAVDDNCQITSASAVAESTAVKDAGYDYAAGLVNFSATCSAPSITVKIYQYGTSADALTVRKHNPSANSYFTINGALLETQTIGGQTVAVATYTIEDNGELDLNPVTGQITDPVGLGNLAAGVPRTGLGGWQ